MMYVWSKLRIYLAFCKGAVRHALTFSWGKKIKVKKIVYLGLLGKCVQVAGLLRRCHFAKLSWGSCCSRVKRQNFGILPKPGIQHSMSYKLQSCSLCGKFYPLASPTCISCGNVSDCLRAPTAPLPWNFFQLGDFQNVIQSLSNISDDDSHWFLLSDRPTQLFCVWRVISVNI